MKKKNILVMTLSLALVAVVAIGATLAYFVSTTNKVENAFSATCGRPSRLSSTVCRTTSGCAPSRP